eukprot:GFUD01004452.1.p1 GENE.GFUD01004452.1~~GFUD01004452.1.p1  ORF type:complete len:492 (-),score=114.28 GFUD01004452.1:414-1889(-)
MCPLYPFHIIILYFCLLLPLLLAVVEGAESLAAWKVSFSASSIGKGNETEKLRELTTKNFEVYCSDCVQNKESIYKLELKNEDPRIASMESGNFTQNDEGLMEMDISGKGREWSISVNVTGTFLGFTSIRSKVEETVKDGNIHAQPSEKPLLLTVTRSKAKKTASKIFGYSVAALISFAYINFGCALDLNVMKEVLRKPIGPAIGLVSQFIFMPLCSFALGYIFPWSSPEMRLGLFVTGTSPGGGASNIWTIMFGGNLDLSVTMTAVSTFAAFFMMPFWIYVLGEVIIDGTQIVIPYMKITTYAVMLVVPLMIGVSIRKCLPKVADFMVKIMKPLALFLIIFILVCGIWSQFFMIKLIDWKIAVVGFALPWLGFAFGCLFSKLCRRERKDIIAIAVETGIQNTGMAIFMLWFTLDHPAGDLAAVVPVAVATLTPFPLLAAMVYYNLRARLCPIQTKEKEVVDKEMDKEVTVSLVNGKEDRNQNLPDDIIKA